MKNKNSTNLVFTTLIVMLITPFLINGAVILDDANELNKTNSPKKIELTSSMSCTHVPSTSEFTIHDLGHPGKELITFNINSDYYSTSWDTDDPVYTTLVFDRGSAGGEFDDNGHGYYKIQVDYYYDDGVDIEYGCSTTALLYP
ncbi:MAG: hypothetical protein FH748_04240 [Balneolaceae bacterium]|nr:hypothetical protein [Balneolaceae bacterium]